MKRVHQELINESSDECDESEENVIGFDNNYVANDVKPVQPEELQMVKDMLDVAMKFLDHHTPIKTKQLVHDLVQPNKSANDNFGRKYLAWNAVGTITSSEDDGSKTLQIHFHDTMGQNKDFILRDLENFTLAALSLQGAIFANEKNVDQTSSHRPNLLYYLPFRGYDNYLSEEFTVRFEVNEKAVLVSTGTGWFAVITCQSMLRVYSTTGISLRNVFVHGRAICLCGRGSMLGIVYYTANGRSLYVDILEITCDAVDINRFIDVAVGFFVPMSENSSLLWAGFSDLLMLTIVDSNGKVNLMSKSSVGIAGWCWSPILDLTEEVRTRYWVVEIRKNLLSYIPLSDGHCVPQRNHNQSYPTLAVKKLCMPLLDVSSEDFLSPKLMGSFAWETIVLTHLESLKGDSCFLSRVVWRVDCLDTLVNEHAIVMNGILLNCAQQCLVNDKINRTLDFITLLRGKEGFEKGRALGVFHNCSKVIEYIDSILRHNFTCDEGEHDHEETASSTEKQDTYSSNLAVLSPLPNTASDVKTTVTQSKSNFEENTISPKLSVVTIGTHFAKTSALKTSTIKNPFAVTVSPTVHWVHKLKQVADELRVEPKQSNAVNEKNKRK